jgi:hypothetical protein
MILLEIAERRGRMNDRILKFPGAVLELEQAMGDLQGQIKGLSKIEMGDDGMPVVTGFSDEAKVASLQEQLNETRSQRDEMLSIIARIEGVFAEHGRPPCSMETIDDRIKEIGQVGRDMQTRLNAIVIDLIVHNRAITLPEIWSHPDVRALEDGRAESIRAGAMELEELQKLKVALEPHLRDEDGLCDRAFYPHHYQPVMNPARISEMSL